MAGEVNDHVGQIVADWRREAPELDTSTIAVIGRVLRAARILSRDIEAELSRFELGVHDFNALSALRRQGEPYELTPTELSRALLFTSGGLTKLVERLERAQLVTRESDPSDGRAVRVRLTEAGRRRQGEAMTAHLENQARLLEPLGAAEREALATCLERLLSEFELDPRARRRAADPAGADAGARGVDSS